MLLALQLHFLLALLRLELGHGLYGFQLGLRLNHLRVRRRGLLGLPLDDLCHLGNKAIRQRGLLQDLNHISGGSGIALMTSGRI
jgi:hypothetical protein